MMVMEYQNQKDNTMRIKCTFTSARKITCRQHSEKGKGVQFFSWLSKDLEDKIINFLQQTVQH